MAIQKTIVNRSAARRSRKRRLCVETLQSRRLFAADLAVATATATPTNVARELRPDVNGDGFVSPIDVLQVINVLADSTRFEGNPFTDVNQDGEVTVDDADAVFGLIGEETEPRLGVLDYTSERFESQSATEPEQSASSYSLSSSSYGTSSSSYSPSSSNPSTSTSTSTSASTPTSTSTNTSTSTSTSTSTPTGTSTGTSTPTSTSRPVAVDDAFYTLDTVDLSGNVLSNDYDPVSGPNQIEVYTVSPPSHGTLVIDVDGSFTYDATDGYNSTDSFEYTIYDGANESFTATVDIEVGRVIINDGGFEVQGAAQDVWVSDFKTPVVQLVNPQTHVIANPQWTVPGKILANWDAGQTPPALTFANLQVVNPGWFWVDGGNNRTVTVTGSVAGQSFNVSTVYNVQRPNITLAVDNSGVIDVYGNKASYGDPNQPPPGIRFDIIGGAPPIPTAGTYQFGYLQVVNATAAYRTDVNGIQESRIQNGPLLDGAFPYPGQIGEFTAIDVPAEPLSAGFQSWSRDDSFSMYVMFQRTGGGIVPLRVVSWSWGFEAESSDNGQTWSLTSTSKGLSPQTDTTNYPTWDGVIDPMAPFQ